jgi:hypothetical protein
MLSYVSCYFQFIYNDTFKSSIFSYIHPVFQANYLKDEVSNLLSIHNIAAYWYNNNNNNNNNNNETDQYQAHFLTKHSCKKVLNIFPLLPNRIKCRCVRNQKQMVRIRTRSMNIVESAMKNRCWFYLRKFYFGVVQLFDKNVNKWLIRY